MQQRRRPLIDEELADRLLDKPRAEGARSCSVPLFPSSNDERGAACAQCVPKRAALATAIQVRACSRAVCKPAPVALQKGLFCPGQLGSAERSQNAPIGGYAWPDISSE
jgi:hypothetical protein